MTYESVPPPLRRVDDGGVLVLKVAAAIGLAAAGALTCTFPAAMRVAAGLAGDLPAVRAWSALGAAALLPMGLSVVVLRGARQGLRSFAASDAGLSAFGAGLFLTALLAGLSVFGELLRETTHHHALAGVTYACGALAFAVVCALGSARVVAILRSLSARARRAAMVLSGGAAVVVIGLLAARFVLAVIQDPASSAAGATVVDVLAFAVSAATASLPWRAARRPLALVGPPVAVFLAALGVTTLRDPPVRRAIGESAPAFAPAADLVSGR